MSRRHNTHIHIIISLLITSLHTFNQYARIYIIDHPYFSVSTQLLWGSSKLQWLNLTYVIKSYRHRTHPIYNYIIII